jgi:uroporphyrinogen-III synthase
MTTPSTPQPLAGKRVALPETRREDLLAEMFAAKGADVFHCPMVEIVDAPDAEPVLDWLRAFCDGRCDDLILLTGEGLQRLAGFARRNELIEPFLAALTNVRKITRGPKPARALGDLGLKPDLAAAQPTTDGVIATLGGESLRGRRIGVQLYADQPNEKLIEFLRGAGAEVAAVAPYRYQPASDDARVLELIDRLVAGEIDVLPFTSAPQVRRLVECAANHGRTERLLEGLNKTQVASIGPVAARELARHGLPVHLTLERNFFMGPLVNAVAASAGDSGIGTQ